MVRPNELPAVVLAGGWVVTTSCEAAAGVMSKAIGGRGGEPGGSRLDGVAVGGLIEGQAGEGGHAGAGVDGEGAIQACRCRGCSSRRW